MTATATGPAKLSLLAQLGADGVVMDGLDAVPVGEAVAAARPDAIVHQMTALSAAHAGKPDLKHPDRFFAATIRLRSEGTDHLLAAAEATGVSHVVAQSFDKRGAGLSDPVAGPPMLDQRVADLKAVISAAGCRRPIVLGFSDGGPIAITLAAAHRRSVRVLILYGTSPRRPPGWAMRQPGGPALAGRTATTPATGFPVAWWAFWIGYPTRRARADKLILLRRIKRS